MTHSTPPTHTEHPSNLSQLLSTLFNPAFQNSLPRAVFTATLLAHRERLMGIDQDAFQEPHKSSRWIPPRVTRTPRSASSTAKPSNGCTMKYARERGTVRGPFPKCLMLAWQPTYRPPMHFTRISERRHRDRRSFGALAWLPAMPRHKYELTMLAGSPRFVWRLSFRGRSVRETRHAFCFAIPRRIC